jgi:hypothetical protein
LNTIGVFCTRPVSVALTVLMAFWSPGPPLKAQEAGGSKLNLIIVEGDGAINNIRQRTAREPIVQVEDENHKPIAGAAVVFLLPGSGPSATFANGSNMSTVFTDVNGRAIAKGLRPNNVAGNFQIRVTANYQGMTGSTVISQSNALAAAAAGGAAAGGISAKLIAIIAIAGAAAAGGAIAATRGGGTRTAATPNPTLTPGTPSVGAPR